jgi:hypothetical protein
MTIWRCRRMNLAVTIYYRIFCRAYRRPVFRCGYVGLALGLCVALGVRVNPLGVRLSVCAIAGAGVSGAGSLFHGVVHFEARYPGTQKMVQML